MEILKPKQMPVSKIDLSKIPSIDVSGITKFATFFESQQKLAETLKNLSDLSNNINYTKLKDSLPTTRKSTPETAIKNLKEAFRNGKLCLVLGAGISSDYGIPNWNDLLQRLLMEDIEEEPKNAIILSKLFSKIFNPSPLIAGRYLQSIFSEKTIHQKFEKEVRKSLYSSYKTDYQSKIVEEIIRLCIAPGKSPNLDSIITYNYDDIIEQTLKDKNLDIPYESIYGQAIDVEDNKLRIFHVHGFLPRIGNISTENKITLGEFVYHEQYNNIYSWNNIVQINKFRDKTCLFIGTSLTDPNIRRLLDISNSQKKNKGFHYMFKKRVDKNWLKTVINKIIEEDPTILKDNSNFKVDDAIDFLIEMKNRFEEKDSESLGVKTVWIDDYDEEISNILNKIRIQKTEPTKVLEKGGV